MQGRSPEANRFLLSQSADIYDGLENCDFSTDIRQHELMLKTVTLRNY